MSFDLFVGSFIGGESAPFPSDILYEAFRPYIARTERNCYVLRFGPTELDTCSLYVDTANAEISDFSINSPLADERLFEAVFTVLKVPGLAMQLPGECPPLVASSETEEHLPQDMIASLGKPILLTAASEIPEYIERA